ncbi:hypothetical protein P280DRAFT_507431 [Massarina eburnea CBS 473.64]|uniref:Uncharacterized protein n=1 Tax=Massarina eburnea CBS 473.64 TaxID=1395130 RepID=A0A6A6S1B1_9PLEO|nr:hypothetical protein P280DRAFT_507431 [Massarina eburnea CBS 473.64]
MPASNGDSSRYAAFEIHNDLKAILDAAIEAADAQRAWCTVHEMLNEINLEVIELTDKPFAEGTSSTVSANSADVPSPPDDADDEEFGDFETADPPKPQDPFKQPIKITPETENDALLPPSPSDTNISGKGLAISTSTLFDTTTRRVRRWGKFALRAARAAEVEAKKKVKLMALIEATQLERAKREEKMKGVVVSIALVSEDAHCIRVGEAQRKAAEFIEQEEKGVWE